MRSQIHPLASSQVIHDDLPLSGLVPTTHTHDRTPSNLKKYFILYGVCPTLSIESVCLLHSERRVTAAESDEVLSLRKQKKAGSGSPLQAPDPVFFCLSAWRFSCSGRLENRRFRNVQRVWTYLRPVRSRAASPIPWAASPTTSPAPSIRSPAASPTFPMGVWSGFFWSVTPF